MKLYYTLLICDVGRLSLVCLLVCLTDFHLSQKMLRTMVGPFLQVSVVEHREGHVQQLSLWILSFLHSGKCSSNIVRCVSKFQEWTLGHRSGMLKMITHLGKYQEGKSVQRHEMENLCFQEVPLDKRELRYKTCLDVVNVYQHPSDGLGVPKEA